MQKNAAHTYAISSLLVLSLTGCAWIPSTPLVQGATSAQPVPGPTPVANGSIFQSAQPINYGYQPLFEDRRPRNIGDTLTIVLQENVVPMSKPPVVTRSTERAGPMPAIPLAAR